ncbi:MAG: C/D box methylation guide ribonucleoprotein complex aNOP56 subunit [Candidatus Thorarchaeota archaeon]|nr:C/D box methylation guide ribonucleoprotein complex aNOP56 subunit [Candidatus Thorarchaeota archaeon]
MPVHLLFTCFGFLLLNKESNVIAEHLVYPSIEMAAREAVAIAEGESTELLQKVASQLESVKPDIVVVEDASLNKALSRLTEIQVTTESDSDIIKWFRDNHDSYLVETGKLDSLQEVYTFRRSVAIEVARKRISSASAEKDLLIKHAIDAIGEIDKSINVLAMRLREWYSLHHPSLDQLVEDNETYVRIVKNCGGSTSLTQECIELGGVPYDLLQVIMESSRKDLGAPLEEKDFLIIRSLSEHVQDLFQMRKELEEYISEMMHEVAPNITTLIGPLVGARLVSFAGSLEELARKPSSTVQILGAEKALFRSLKTGAAPPKHGIIYQVPEIHSAPYWHRGKIARALAGRISIAARVDAFSERNIGDFLRQKFLERVEEIKRQHPEAPVSKAPMKPLKRPKRNQTKQRSGSHGRKKGGRK